MNDNNRPESNSGGKPNQVSNASTPPVIIAGGKDAKDRRMLTVIVIAGIITVLLIALIIIGIVKTTAKKPETTNNVSAYEISSLNPDNGTSITGTQIPVTYETISQPEVIQKTDVSESEPSQNDSVTAAANHTEYNTTENETRAQDTGNNVTDVQTTVPQTIEGLPPLEKTGDNILSDDPENEYIKLVGENRHVDTALLVAIYSVPDEGNNFVLEFDGSKDEAGKLIKSPDTLLKVHQIDKSRKIKTATVNGLGNVGVGYAEGKLVFYMVTNIVMPQYPDYFTGVKK